MSPAIVIDLDAYLQRIGYAGPRTPSLTTLRALHLAHAQAIPFENLDPLLGRPTPLDPPSLMRKLVHGKRGGYCFEQNLLFSHALRQLGFAVAGLTARVIWNQAENAETMRSHMLLAINLPEGPHIADVGFGGLTLTGPLRLAADLEQQTPHEAFRLLRSEDEFTLQAQVAGAWKGVYRFDLRPTLQIDYEVLNYYLSTNPASHFVPNLIVARPRPGRRDALLNSSLAIHWLGGPTERRELTSASAMREALETIFDLRLDRGPALDAALERLIGSGDRRQPISATTGPPRFGAGDR